MTMSRRGSDHSAVPRARSLASLLRLAREMATKPPTIAPTPKAESMMPTACGPRSRMSTAKVDSEDDRRARDDRLGAGEDGDHDEVAIRPYVREAATDLLEHAAAAARRLRPASASSGAGTSTSRATGWMPETRNAERRKVATLRKKTVGTLVAVTSSAPSAGPMKNARLSMVLEAPFAAVSSAGLLVSDGIQAIWAGRKTEPPRAARVATTRTDQVGASTSTRTAATATRQARTRSEPMRIALRGRRSASDEPSGAATAMSRRRIAPQMPMSLTPPAP